MNKAFELTEKINDQGYDVLIIKEHLEEGIVFSIDVDGEDLRLCIDDTGAVPRVVGRTSHISKLAVIVPDIIQGWEVISVPDSF